MIRLPTLWTFFSVAYLAVLYAPVAFLVLFAFNAGTVVAFPLRGVTFRWFVEMASSGPLLEALGNSLKVASTSAIISTALGALAAKALSRSRLPGRGLIAGLLAVPLVVPGIVLGIALLILENAAGIEPSLNTIRVAHVLFCLPFAMLVLLPRFQGMDGSLEEASRDLGEGLAGTFVRVVLPLVAPGLLASLLLTFTVSLDEFILTFFVAGSQSTLPLFIWSQLRFPGKLPDVLALSTCILAVSFLLVSLAEWARRLGPELQTRGH